MTKYIQTFESYNNLIWYRGCTPKQFSKDITWLTSNKKLAQKYSEINAILNGDNGTLKEFKLDLSKFNILDLDMYDMDEKLSIEEMDQFLNDVDIKYEAIELFDIEETIPLSRLVNSIIDELLKRYDGLTIKESRSKTLAIRTVLLN